MSGMYVQGAMREEFDGVAVKLFPFLVGLTWRVRIQQVAIWHVLVYALTMLNTFDL